MSPRGVFLLVSRFCLPAEPPSSIPLSIHTLSDAPSHILSDGWPALACTILVTGSSLPSTSL